MKNTKEQKTPAPQFVIFDPPITGFEARAEMRVPKELEHYIRHGRVVQQSEGMWTHEETPVLTPVKRIEDLLPPCKCECWAVQFESGLWALCAVLPEPVSGGKWKGIANGWVNLPSEHFNPFGLPIEPNPRWRETLYHFQVGQGWRKVGGK